MGNAGLPFLGREKRDQWSRNLRRCQPITVLGWTKTSALRQPDQARDSHAQEAIGDPDAGSSAATLIDGELVAQGEDLEVKGGPGAKAGAEGGDESEED